MLRKQFQDRSSFFRDGTFREEASDEKEADPLIEDDKNKNLIHHHQLGRHHRLSFCFGPVMFIMSVSKTEERNP